MAKHFNITVFGLVQGVNFRTSAAEQARSLGITGFAKNTKDGNVYIEAEGDEAALRKFISWCEAGTPWAKVERVEAAEGQMKNFREFRIDR